MLYVTYTLNFLLMLAMPFLLAAFLARRLPVRWGLFWVGAVTFIGSQIVHIPLNVLLGRLGVLTAYRAGTKADHATNAGAFALQRFQARRLVRLA